MSNPWDSILLTDYETHMSQDNVFQLQTLKSIMAEQLTDYNFKNVMILGVAGGNGLEHISPRDFEVIHGVDINSCYLETCAQRYPNLKDVFVPICADLCDESIDLPQTDWVIANLLIEYIGYSRFQKVLLHVAPKVVSCVIIDNRDQMTVSDSSNSQVFDRLGEVYHQIDEPTLDTSMADIGFIKYHRRETLLPNGKALIRLDYIASTAVHIESHQ
ncbi:MAG: methyltransferase type 11 [Clostridiaceae bacterium]|nr:methyltransferase type 11 [Clostridiaceae bacterium]